MNTTPKYERDGDGYMGLLGAIFEKAHADAAGEGMGDIYPTARPAVSAEAAEFLAWARTAGLDATADRDQVTGIFRGRRL